MIDLPAPPVHEVVARNVAACGVPAANIVAIAPGPTSMGGVRIVEVGGATPEKFRCIAGAVGTLFVNIDDDQENLAYWRLVVEDGRAEVRAEAESWLSARNLLATLPRFRGGQTALEPVLRAVERHCGVEGEPALVLTDVGSEHPAVEFNPAQFESLLRNGPQPVHICVSYALTASGLPEADIQVPSLPFSVEAPGAE